MDGVTTTQEQAEAGPVATTSRVTIEHNGKTLVIPFAHSSGSPDNTMQLFLGQLLRSCFQLSLLDRRSRNKTAHHASIAQERSTHDDLVRRAWTEIENELRAAAVVEREWGDVTVRLKGGSVR